MNLATLSQKGGPNYKITGSHLEWDMWRFNFRVDKRPGLVLSNLDVKDGDKWRSVIYQSHLSEVFVPYMDPTEGWYWRTYMDSGEYGFGLFLSPLRAGVDCPSYATFLPATIADDKGNPLTIPNAICVFERSIGDPAWRHFEVFAQTPDKPIPAEGRPGSELVVRTASEVGNYDYLIDYRLQQDGQIRLMIGATGLDAVKGVQSTSMNDKTAADDTAHGTLIAPNLVAANHDHYFNFRIDFDVDQPVNHFGTMDIVPAKVDPKNPRRSMWTVQHTMPKTEMEARYQLSAMKPRYFMVSDPSREGYLGQEPGWMIHHGDVAYGPFDFEKDPPMKRNAYIEYSVWNTVYDPDQQYAGGKFAMQSDGSDTLPQWVKKDKPLMGQDIVTWFTAGFHHIPRMEDWPVMSTEWKTIHIEPHNFFAHNPALTIRDLGPETQNAKQ
jgi:primary-amine oxidase